jgi:hypothetical protein
LAARLLDDSLERLIDSRLPSSPSGFEVIDHLSAQPYGHRNSGWRFLPTTGSFERHEHLLRQDYMGGLGLGKILLGPFRIFSAGPASFCSWFAWFPVCFLAVSSITPKMAS